MAWRRSTASPFFEAMKMKPWCDHITPSQKAVMIQVISFSIQNQPKEKTIVNLQKNDHCDDFTWKIIEKKFGY